MTSTIRVNSREEALDLVYRRLPIAIRNSVRELFKLIEQHALPEAQKKVWGDGLAQLSEYTVRLRRERIGYYRVVKKNSRASAEGPAFEWSGRLRKATQRFAQLEKASATIDPDRAYKGPLRRVYGDNVFSAVVQAKTSLPIHDVLLLERLLDREVFDRWTEKTVIPRMRSGASAATLLLETAADRGEESF